MHRLHSEIEPAFFSTKFRPMSHLVGVLSAEAKQRQKRFKKRSGESDDNDDQSDVSEISAEEELSSMVRVLTLEGRVIRIHGLKSGNTVSDLRKAIAKETGSSLLEMRLYIDLGTSQNRALGDLAAASSLELLHDGTRTLDEVGLLVPPEWRAVHLRNREYEALRTQLAVATEVVERILEEHYEEFATNFHAVADLANEFDSFAQSLSEARTSVAKARIALGLPGESQTDLSSSQPHHTINEDVFAQQDTLGTTSSSHIDQSTDIHHDASSPHSSLQITAAWEDKIEAEEALRLLNLLRQKFPRH